VLAASYEAKAFGVHGGMAGWRAKRLCPSLRFVGGHFREYQRLGDEVVAVFNDFTPLVERISIDEAFLDVRGSRHLFGTPAQMAAEIRRRVRDEIGLPVSVGVARTKHLAKIASQVAKPDGVVVVEPDGEMEFLAPLPVGLMWGVGPVTGARLAERGVLTIGDLAAMPGSALEHLVGHAVGTKLGDLSRNHDPRAIEMSHRARSVGAQSAFGRRLPTETFLAAVLGHLADRVAVRLRAKQRAGRTVTVRVRFVPFRSVTRSLTLPAPVCTTVTLTEIATSLVATARRDVGDETELSLLAISVSNLVDQPALQLELPIAAGAHDALRPGTPAGSARWAVDRSIDAVRARFGRAAVGYASVALSELDLVPDEFRELAERDG
jgi:DNA polymerase IV